MYTEGAQAAGHHRFLQHINTSTSCPCKRCVPYDQSGHSVHGGSRYLPASARQTGHPSPDCRRDTQAPWVKDVGGRAFAADGIERSGHCSPQRKPVFTVPGPCSQSEDLSHVCPWEFNPAQWNYPLEPGQRHYPPVREQRGCVVCSDTRAHPMIPHPLPHLQVKGQRYGQNMTVRYNPMEEESCCSENYHLDSYNPHQSYLPNGHCGQRSVFFEGGEERDSYQERGRLKGGSEDSCNGLGGSYKGYFPTEVPQKDLNQSREKGPCVPPSGITSPRPPRSTAIGDHRQCGSEVARQKRRQDLVRDQIRLVVTDLEDVLGGLKQVHVEMKEVGGPLNVDIFLGVLI